MTKGFTLIQSIIVAAILCILAILIFFAIDPIEKRAKTQDDTLLTVTTQLGQALTASADANKGAFPTTNDTINAAISTYGNYTALKVLPCVLTSQYDSCYKKSTEKGPVITYARLSSKVNNSRCPANTLAWAVYSSADTKGGIACIPNGETPIPGNQTFLP